MRWIKGEPDEHGIVWYQTTRDGRYMVSRARVTCYDDDEPEEEWRYTAWGPPGSQDVGGIVAMTVDALRKMQHEPAGELRVMNDGRAHLGEYRNANDAFKACEDDAEQEQVK